MQVEAASCLPDIGVSQNQGYLFWGAYNNDSSILGSILWSPYSGKLPHDVESLCLLLDELTHVQVVQGASGLDMNPEFMGFRV